ncbi:MAG: FHA domain-containing protein [Acidimicrobiia bacterium]
MATVTCPRCGHANQLPANFCSSCGADLGAEPDHTTATVAVPIEGPDEVALARDEMPAGIGMLVVTRGPNTGSRFALDAPVTTAGRHPDSTIFLDDITVSRRHAEIRQVGDTYRVVDVGSLNGTYLNRERVEEAELTDGDEVQIGTFKLVFLAGTR